MMISIECVFRCGLYIHPSSYFTESDTWMFKMYCILLSTIAIPILVYLVSVILKNHMTFILRRSARVLIGLPES